MLYTGGRENTNSEKIHDFLHKQCFVEVESFAVSDSFIVFGVSSFRSVDGDLPYFGNPIKHVTYAVKKGCRPVNSPSAFSEGITYKFPQPLMLEGILEVVCKK